MRGEPRPGLSLSLQEIDPMWCAVRFHLMHAIADVCPDKWSDDKKGCLDMRVTNQMISVQVLYFPMSQLV